MSDKKIQVTVIVSDEEAKAIEKMSEAEKASLTEALTEAIRQKMAVAIIKNAAESLVGAPINVFMRSSKQVMESNRKLTRLDEVMGNTHLED